MVIFYDTNTKELHHTEDNVMIPELPSGTMEEKRVILAQQGLNFVGVPYELGKEVLNYKLCFDISENFIGLQPK